MQSLAFNILLKYITGVGGEQAEINLHWIAFTQKISTFLVKDSNQIRIVALLDQEEALGLN